MTETVRLLWKWNEAKKEQVSYDLEKGIQFFCFGQGAYNDLVVPTDPDNFFQPWSDGRTIVLIVTRKVMLDCRSLHPCMRSQLQRWDDKKAPIGMFFKPGNNSTEIYCIITKSMEELASDSMFEIWRKHAEPIIPNLTFRPTIRLFNFKLELAGTNRLADETSNGST